MSNPWGKTDHEMEQAVEIGWAALAENRRLREAVRSMTAMLEAKEWANLLSTDADIAGLDAAISALTAAQPKGEKFCNKCGYFGPDEMHNRPRDGKQCDYLSCPVKKADERGSAEPVAPYDPENETDGETRAYQAGYSRGWDDRQRHGFTAPARDGSEPGLREALQAALAMFPVALDGQTFCINGGPLLRADDDDTFYSKRKVGDLLRAMYDHLKKMDAALAATPEQQAEP